MWKLAGWRHWKALMANEFRRLFGRARGSSQKAAGSSGMPWYSKFYVISLLSRPNMKFSWYILKSGSTPVSARVQNFERFIPSETVENVQCSNFVHLEGTRNIYYDICIRRLTGSRSNASSIYTRYMKGMPARLHSSVSRTLHRYRGGHGFESCWSLRIDSGLYL